MATPSNVAPTRVAPPQNATQPWTNYVYSLNYSLGIPVYPGEGPFDENFYLGYLPQVVFDISASINHLARVAQAGFQGAHDYATAVATYAATLAQNTGAGAGAAATAAAQALFNRAEADATAKFNQAEADLNTWAHAFVRSLNDVQNNTVGYSTGLFNRAEADISTVWTNAYNTAMNVQANALAHTEARFNQAEADLNTWATALVQADRDVQANLANAITNTSAEDRQYADSQIQAFIPAIISQAVTQVQPQLDKITTDINTCLEPLCDTVTPNAKDLGKLGKTLGDFATLGVVGLLVGFAAEAIADPRRAATQAEDALSWTTDVGTELVNAVYQ